MATTDLAQIQHRRDTAANWVIANSLLASGEIGVETDTHLEKMGDGVTLWNTLGYRTEQLAKQIDSATSKATPVDADEIPLADSAATFGLKKLTLTNLAAWLASLAQTLTNKTLTDPKIVRALNNQTGTAYTPVLTDQSMELTVSNASPVAFTIPTNASVAFPVGASFRVVNKGAGLLTITAVTPATTIINSLGSTSTAPTVNQYGTVTCTQIVTDVWEVTGDVVQSGGSAWTAFTSTVTAQTGTITTVSATTSYSLAGKTCFYRGSITITNAGSGAGFLYVTLPVPASATGFQTGSAKEVNITGSLGSAAINDASDATHLYLVKYDNTTWITNSYVVAFNITYQVA